jgi:hypothetical protein
MKKVYSSAIIIQLLKEHSKILVKSTTAKEALSITITSLWRFKCRSRINPMKNGDGQFKSTEIGIISITNIYNKSMLSLNVLEENLIQILSRRMLTKTNKTFGVRTLGM